MSISLFLYLVCAIAYIWVVWSVSASLFRGRELNQTLLIIVGSLGALAHISGVLNEMYMPDGIDFSLLRSISLIVAVTTLLVIFGSQQRPVRPLLLVVIPLSFILIPVSELSGPAEELLQINAGEATHIVLSILAFGVLTIATAEAVLLNIVSSRLKHHRVNPTSGQLPPVESLENLMFELIGAGTLILLTAIVTGVIFLQSFAEQQLYHKFFFSLLGLILYSCLWWGHRRYGWRGRKALRWSIGAYLCLLLAYAGSKIVLEWIL